MATKAEVAKLMGLMASAWPRYELQAPTVELYARLMADIDPATLEKAAIDLISKNTFFPSVSEWRKAAIDLEIDAMHIPSAFEAWEDAMREVQTKGSYKTPEFSHPLIQRAVDIIGYKTLCWSEQIEYERAHFFKIYESLQRRAEEEIRTLPEVKEYARLQQGNKTMQLMSGLAQAKTVGGES